MAHAFGELVNGDVFRSPSEMLGVVQWISEDMWVLLGEPHVSGGQSSAVVVSDPNGSGRVFYTQEEMATRLVVGGWQREPGCVLIIQRLL